MNRWQGHIERLLEGSGVALNGPNSWDPQIHNQGFYARVMRQGTLGLGESYIDGWWDAEQLDVLFSRLLETGVARRLRITWPVVLAGVSSLARNLQSRRRAFAIGREHYDLGNDLYAAMLGPTFMYSSGYWREATTLDAAQSAKLDLICRALNLQEGQRLLDIGCGWGSLLKYAAERYGVRGVGVTVSKEQAALARERCRGLPIDIRLHDYRDLTERFDHVVSVGMFEHVGYKNYRTFFEVVKRTLKDDGLCVLYTIGSLRTSRAFDPWVAKYIFPNSMLPSMCHITKAVEGLFVIEDWHDFGAYYDPTLMAWYENFVGHWAALKAHYSERFFRMWRYYLLSCAGSFRARYNQLWQIVLSPHGVAGGYQAVR